MSSKIIHDIICFVFLYIVMIVGFIFTIESTERTVWFKKVFGGTENSMRLIHRASFWGLIVTSLCLLLAFLFRGK